MNNKSQTVRVAFWILLGIAILISSLAPNRPLLIAQDTTATPSSQTGTIVATTEPVEDVGSTDEIMLMAALIVLIIITPILLRRKAWLNGKRKK